MRFNTRSSQDPELGNTSSDNELRLLFEIQLAQYHWHILLFYVELFFFVPVVVHSLLCSHSLRRLSAKINGMNRRSVCYRESSLSYLHSGMGQSAQTTTRVVGFALLLKDTHTNFTQCSTTPKWRSVIVQSTDTCFLVPQLISVAWYNLDMAWQLFIPKPLSLTNRLWDNSVGRGSVGATDPSFCQRCPLRCPLRS